jgi:hypothetical protein
MTLPVDRWRYFFIHNVFVAFFNDMMEYMKYLYPRFQYTVFGTYDKAVEYLNKKQQYCRETDKPFLPALILNPSGDFDLADAISGGRQLWRFPNLAWGFNKYLFDPIYQDKNLQVYVSFMRIKGEIEFLTLLNSFYEYTDVRMMFLNYFGGIDRIIEPSFFTSFIILPEDLVNYTYTNEYTGQTYKIDWFGAGARIELVKTTGKEELVVPCRVKPQISLTSLSDASARYGGTDKLADWRLGGTINYEVELPNMILLEGDYLAEHVDIELKYGSAFSAYNSYDVPVNRQRIEYTLDWKGLNESSDSRIDVDAIDSTGFCEITETADLVFNTRYFHPVSGSEADSTSDLIITIPEVITDEVYLIVNSINGKLDYGDHYSLADDGVTVTIRHDTIDYKEGWIIELYIYDRIDII